MNEIWCLTLREEHTFMLGSIFGPKVMEVAGCWRRLHNEEFHNF